LTTTFPGIQFIMTTHAPQVVASCEASWLRVLPAGRTATAPTMANASQGKDVNAVLREIMAAPERLPIVHNKLQQVRDLVEDRQASAARIALDEVAPAARRDR
jgi:predicted ATP-binding protein involved in virulence